MSFVMRKPFQVFLTGSDTYLNLQPQKMVRDLKFRKYSECSVYVAKTKALISCAVIAQLICAFVFAHAKKQVFSSIGSNSLRRCM